MESNDSSVDSCYVHIFSSAEIWITSIAYVIIIIASVIGNCLVTWVVYSSPLMRTPSHYFIVNMAVADLLITVFGMPVAAREQIISTDAIDFGGIRGEIYCKMLEYTKDVSISCSILTLVAIATDRFCATLIPFKRLITLTKAKVMMFLIWIVSLVVTIPLLVVANVIEYENNKFFCYEDWTVFHDLGASKMEHSYTIALFIILYAAPLVIISILYGAVIRKIWKRKIPGQTTHSGRQMQQRTKKKVLKIFMTVVVCFMACWLPYHVILFTYNFDCYPPINLWFFARFLGHTNSSITPWIYIIYGRDYRLGAKRILKKVLGKADPLPSFCNRSVQIPSNLPDINASNLNNVTLKTFTNKI
ncbi:neuropeptide FF receptor 2-like [Actinia tenebrosa]|uniref:Neuropeptide FF receptor 2-like n=1 Tax=Actinia tenebrosa TaxID=6105 RepID=A0A6P8J561_ACTTE|nr:neuropeptide FF receptor 2-like [Actinia tenebrosa]